MSSRKRKTGIDHDRYTAEMSTGQLVIGVCILLMFGLGCFLLGVLIGRIDPSLRNGEPELERVAATPVNTTPEPPAAPTPTAEPELRPPRDFPERSEPGQTQPETEPEDTEPVSTTSAPAQDDEAIDQPEPEPVAERPEPEQKPEPVETRSPPSPQVVAAPPPSTRAAPPSSPTVAETTEEPAPDRPRFGVQIAAFQTRERAEVSMRELEAKSPYRGQIVVGSNGRLFKVVAGSYADNATAAQARQDLRTRYNYSDCFVTPL